MTIVIQPNTPSPEKPTLLIENVFTQGVLVGSGGGVRENALGDNTFEFWTPTEPTAAMIVELDVARNCDCVGIAAHNLGTVGARIRVQTSDTGTSPWITRVTILPQTDKTILGIFPSVGSRFWRLIVNEGPASIGVIKLGRRIIVPSGVALGHVAANHAERVELLSNDSIDGQFLNTRVIRRSGQTNLDFGLVPASFVQNEMGEFERLYNEGRTFFYAGSPQTLPRDVAYCKRPMGGSEMRPSYEGGELMQMNLEAQIYAW